MSILKFEPNTPRTLAGIIEYILDDRKTDENGLIGIGVNPMNAKEEMKMVQQLYYRENLCHEYIQVIFAFDVGLKSDIETLREVCTRIGEALIWDKRQVLGAIHYIDTNKVHVHYVINYVGLDGSLYKQKYSIWHYKQLVNDILGEYGYSPIVCQ